MPLGFVNCRWRFYRSAALVNDTTVRLKQLTRRFRSSLTMLAPQSAASRNSRRTLLSLWLLKLHEATGVKFGRA